MKKYRVKRPMFIFDTMSHETLINKTRYYENTSISYIWGM